MASLLEYTCPNCGGSIKFDAVSQAFMCESCDSVFTEQQLAGQLNTAEQREKGEASAHMPDGGQKYNWNNESSDDTLGEMSVYSCRSCGAEITTDTNTIASACPYCNAPIIMTGKVSGMLKPNCCIPFKLDKKGAMAALKNHCKGKILLPSNFITDSKVDELNGLYVPFWLFDADINARLTYDATRTRSWSDANYSYTETSHYKLYRSGNIGYSEVPVDGSKKMADDYMDGIEPFDYKDMSEFNPAFLSGFMADKYDVSAIESFPRAELRIKNSTIDAFRSTVSGYGSVTPAGADIYPQHSSYKYSLMPVWMMNAKYNGKMYTYAINGQTGRVSGELPTDKKKAAALFAGVAAAVVLIGQLAVFFL